VILYKQNGAKLCEGYMCDVADCLYTNGNAKNWRQRMRAHYKKIHGGLTEPQFIHVQLQEINLNQLVLVGRTGIEALYQTEADMIFSAPRLGGQDPPEVESPGLNVLQKLEYYNQSGSDRFIADWERFVRTELSLNLVATLFEEDTNLKSNLDAVVDAWFVSVTLCWNTEIASNYALRETLMKHEDDSQIFKSLKLKSIRTKSVPLLKELLWFAMNFCNLEPAAIPPVWSTLFSSEALSACRSLHQVLPWEHHTLENKVELVYTILDELTKAKYSLNKTIATCVMPSAFLITWIFRQGLSRVQLHLRNTSSKAYAYENLCRIVTAVLYMKYDRDTEILSRTRLQFSSASGHQVYRTSLDMAHQIFKLTSSFRSGQSLIKMEPIDSPDPTLHRFPNGAMWSLDRLLCNLHS
jgi:hypothetical protein